MKTSVLFVVVLVLALTVSAKTRWNQLENYRFEDYVLEFNKIYETEAEYDIRKAIFDESLVAIKLHNQDSTQTWKMGVNHFTDMTVEELQQYGGYRRSLSRVNSHHARDLPDNFSILDEDQLPESVDWTTRVPNVISAVKDQGRCGSCWAFAATEAIESYLALATGDLYSLSPQNMLSCAPNPLQCGGTGGCNGATSQIGFQHVIEQGIPTIWTFPYTSYQGSTGPCTSLNSHQPAVQMNITGFVDLPRNEYLPLLNAVARIGPIVVSVSASGWHYYESGVFTSPYTDINHAVLLVGYGTDNGVPYWKVRNSWSPSWGESGYIRIARTTDCAVDYVPLDGSDCVGGPETEIVCGECGIFFDSSYPVIQ